MVKFSTIARTIWKWRGKKRKKEKIDVRLQFNWTYLYYIIQFQFHFQFFLDRVNYFDVVFNCDLFLHNIIKFCILFKTFDILINWICDMCVKVLLLLLLTIYRTVKFYGWCIIAIYVLPQSQHQEIQRRFSSIFCVKCPPKTHQTRKYSMEWAKYMLVCWFVCSSLLSFFFGN